MPDLLIRNVKPETMAWLKAEAKRHGRSLSNETKVVIIRRLWHDGDFTDEQATEELAALGATLKGDD